MKRPHYSTHTRPLFALALAATACVGFAFAPASASAQTTTTKTIIGAFKFNDGNKGTYVTTITKTDTADTEVTVFTRVSDKATSTDTTVTTDNSDGTKLVTYSHNDFGATALYTSSKTVTPEKHGEAYGTGTFTNAAGVSGSLATLETKIGNINAASETYTTSTGISSDLHLKDSELGFTADKTIARAADGTVSTSIHTRFIAHVE